MITQQQLQEIGEWLSTQTLDEEVNRQLRQRFEGLHFTYCMDDDVIAAEPVYEAPTFNLYLVNSGNHCFNFTQDMKAASGVVVAELDTPCL